MPRLWSTPGFTEASANVAKDFYYNAMVSGMQRYVKRIVEGRIFRPILDQAGLDPHEAKVRLHWGVETKPEILIADVLKAAELGIIKPHEVRKMLVNFGWELELTEAPAGPAGSGGGGDGSGLRFSHRGDR